MQTVRDISRTVEDRGAAP